VLVVGEKVKNSSKWIGAKPEVHGNEQGELTATYRWTGWILENNRLKFGTSGKLPLILEESMNLIQVNKEQLKDHNM